MTPFKKNITKSIDNLNRICKTILSVYDNKTIDKMLSDNVLNQSGSDLTFNNTVAGGKFDWEIQGKCEQDTTSISGGDEYDSPTPDHPQPIRVVTGDNEFVVSNKNLFTGFTKDKGIDFTTGVEQNNSNGALSDYIPVNFITNPNYYISGLTNTLRSLVNAYNSNKQSLGRTGGNPQTFISLNSSSFTSGTPQGTGDIAYIRIYQYKISSDTGTIDDIDNLQTQLEPGSTATSYVPHAEQKVTIHLGTEYLAGIDDYKDEIVGKTDDWKIVRKVHKINFKDLNFTLNSELANVVRTRATLPKTANDGSGICNGFLFEIQYYTNREHFYCQSFAVWVFIKKDRLSAMTQKAINDFIQANDFYAYYIKATPTEETITDTSLISDLNNMYNLMGYDGQTNISIIPSTRNAQGTLKVTAFVTEKEGD